MRTWNPVHEGNARVAVIKLERWCGGEEVITAVLAWHHAAGVPRPIVPLGGVEDHPPAKRPNYYELHGVDASPSQPVLCPRERLTARESVHRSATLHCNLQSRFPLRPLDAVDPESERAATYVMGAVVTGAGGNAL